MNLSGTLSDIKKKFPSNQKLLVYNWDFFHVNKSNDSLKKKRKTRKSVCGEILQKDLYESYGKSMIPSLPSNCIFFMFQSFF